VAVATGATARQDPVGAAQRSLGSAVGEQRTARPGLFDAPQRDELHERTAALLLGVEQPLAGHDACRRLARGWRQRVDCRSSGSTGSTSRGDGRSGARLRRADGALRPPAPAPEPPGSGQRLVHVLKNETLRLQLVSLCFGYVDVSGDGPLQRVATGLSTHVFLFRHPQWMSRLNARSLLAPSFPFSPLLSSSSIFLAALTSRFQKFALHRLLVPRKTFRVNWSRTFMLASLAGAPDEGQFDTALSQSAWIHAPLGQTRLVLVLAAPGDQRRPRSSSVLNRSVVTRRVMSEAQSCSIVPTLVAAHDEGTAGRLGRGHTSPQGGDAGDENIALRELLLPALGFSRVVVEGRSRALVLADSPRSWGSSRRFVAYMADPGMAPARDPRCHRGTRELVQLAHSM
jgi:hypothetical protein